MLRKISWLRQPRCRFRYTRSPCDAGKAGDAARLRRTLQRGGRQFDVCPGGHAKWVQIPHGPATVSGERHLIGMSLGVAEPGKTRGAATTRESGHLVSPGASFFGARDAERSPDVLPPPSAAGCGLPSVSRHRFFLVLLTLIVAPAPAAAADLAGQVVDATGRALPRAYVRVLAENGATVAGGFTDESGRFALTGPGSVAVPGRSLAHRISDRHCCRARRTSMRIELTRRRRFARR